MMGDHGSMDGGMMGGAFGISAVVWTLLGIALLVLIVLAIVWLALRLRRDDRERVRRASSPLSELEGRYARGEIDREAYLQIRSDLDAR
ncbi:MAG: SHOCT domain-containing protein [Chloroflexota bacterium]|nr:SHOCT domain-containing protein [Chloroflexota bacterium]